MTSIWQDSGEAEFDAYEDAADDYGEAEAEAEYGEESRAERRRRARIALARRRQAETRARARAARYSPMGRVPSRPMQQTAAAVRTLDLESKVAEDRLRSSVSSQSQRMSRAEYSAAAAVIASQAVQSLDGPDNPYLRAGLLASPLLLLAPQHRRRGVEGWITDPRVIGLAGTVGIAFLGEQRRASSKVKWVDLQSPGPVPAGQTRLVIAQPRDRNGVPITTPVSWDSRNQDIVRVRPVDATTGEIEVLADGGIGDAVITATAGGITTSIVVRRIPPDPAVPGNAPEGGN